MSVEINNSLAGFPSGDGNAVELQSVPVSVTGPTDGQVLTYDSGEGQWEPATPASGDDFPLANDTYATARNAADDANINLIKADTQDQVQVGDVDNAAAIVSGQSASLEGPTGITASTDSFFWVLPYDGGTAPKLQLSNGDLTGTVSLEAPASLSGSLPFVLPAADGNSGDALVTDGSGNLSFAPASASSLSTPDAAGTTDFIEVVTGDSSGADSGYIGIYTGSATGFQSGPVDSATGDISSGTGTTGYYLFQTGTKSGGTGGGTGNIDLVVGDADVGNSGDITLQVGSAAGTQGDIRFIKAGVPSVVGQIWTASGTSGEGYWDDAPVGTITGDNNALVYLNGSGDAVSVNNELSWNGATLDVNGDVNVQDDLSVGTNLTVDGGSIIVGTKPTTSLSAAIEAWTPNGGVPMVFGSEAGGGEGAVYFITTTTYAEIGGTQSAGGATQELRISPQGSPLKLGSGTGSVYLPGYSDGTLSVSSGVIVSSSDGALKDIEMDYNSGLSAVEQITPKLYKWKSGTPMGANGRMHAGFIAQNIEQAIPEAVDIDKNGHRSLEDRAIIATLVNAIKELSAKVKELEAKS